MLAGCGVTWTMVQPVLAEIFANHQGFCLSSKNSNTSLFPPDSQTTPGPTRRALPPLLLHLPAQIQSAGEQAAPHNLFAGGIFLQYCMIEIIPKQASWQLWPLLACSTAWPSGEKWLKSTWQSTCILSQSTFPSWAPSLERSLVPSEELITSNSQQLH